jgi:rod shape-determining protein MreD
MKISPQILWILALLFVQQLPAVSSWGIDLPLIFVILTGLRTTAPKAAGWGFLLGVIQDLLSTAWLGPNTIAKTLTGILCSFSKRYIYRERVLTQTFLVFWAALFHQAVVWWILKWDGSAPAAEDAVWICLRTVLNTTLAGVVVCFFVVRFRRRRHDPATA